ncbi:MAG: hypothetical protein ACLS8V_00570 [Ruminococcus sp.]|jgi:hypothetical protein|uniref:hypothetical protein n=1 Tax=Ruminococcus sp. TaxID=41978 RepID=UPI000623B3EE|nr:hypothetical protein [uncultured Ruminococcus sp.]
MINIDDVYAYLGENEPDIANSICYASEWLLSKIDEAIEALKERRITAASNDNDEEYERLKNYRDKLKEYKRDINKYLNYAESNSSDDRDSTPSQFIPGFESDSDIAQDEMYQEKVDYAKYAVDSSKPHTLNENYTHKKICRFMYNGTKYNVTDWTDALIKICNILVKKPKKTFETLIDSPNFKGRKISYFGSKYVKDKNMKIDGTNVYVWTNLSTNAIADLIQKILIAFNENPGDFYVYLKADYTPLHYGDSKQEQIRPITLSNDEEKIGKHVQKCMRELEAKQYHFTHNELLALLNVQESKKIFGITYPFFTDNKSKIYDKNGHIRFWKEPFRFNGKYYYITSQWFDHNREKFDAWFKGINRNVR